jgi:hypothetical protein
MRVILDTNVLLGALISPHGPPDVIYRAWRAARFELVSSMAQLDELRRVSRYPKLKSMRALHATTQPWCSETCLAIWKCFRSGAARATVWAGARNCLRLGQKRLLLW